MNSLPRHSERSEAIQNFVHKALDCFVALLLAMTAAIFIFSSASARASVLDIQEVTSAGGITAWLVEDHSVPVIALQFAFKGAGSRNETRETQGLARIVSNTLDEGAGELTSQEFQKELQDLSISLSFGANRDDFTGHVKTLTANSARAFDLLELALTQPRFDEEPLARMIAANRTRILSSLSDPRWAAARLMNDKAFAGHPYALNSGGTLSTLPTITPAMLRDFTAANLTRDRLKVAVAGDITPEKLKPLLDDIFGALPEKAAEAEIPDLELKHQGDIILHPRPVPQTVIEIIQPGIDRADPDYHLAQVMNFALGSSGFGSRLTEEIREKAGLTYGIYSSLDTMDKTDTLSVATSTENANAGKVLDMIRAEWKKMAETGITEKELEDAKAYLIGSLPLSLTSTDAIAGLALSIQLDGFAKDYLDQRETAIRNATLEDVHRVAQELLQPENFTVVMVGKPEGVSPTQTVEKLPNVE